MGSTRYIDIYDAEIIANSIGMDWANDAKVFKSGVIKHDNETLRHGSRIAEIRVTRFQGRAGQALKAGDSISGTGHTQQISYHPVLWRYDMADESDVTAEIEAKDFPKVNANLASDIREAGAQYVDDSAVSVIEGTAAALSENQYGDGLTTISLDELILTKAALDDGGEALDGGAIFMRSDTYWKLARMGLVSATSNTFGNAAQETVVLEGRLPVTIVGLTPIMTNKITSPQTGGEFVYFVGAKSMVFRGVASPKVESLRETDSFSTKTKFEVKYSIGFNGCNWILSGKEDVSDSELATAANWEKASFVSKHIPLARLHTTLS